MKNLKIGNVELENRYLLGPMAGVTDLPFRLLCKEQGAGLLCMEMISAKALQYKNKNTKTLLAIHPEEYPVSLQLFGSEPDIISEIAKMIEPLPFQILDINMGCPVPKIVKNGEGSALMLRPELVYEIVSKTAKAIKKPVTVKIRKGFDDAHINAVEIAKHLIRTGADIVTDTNMALSGVNKKVLEAHGGMAHCFMADEEVAGEAKERKGTRAVVSMEHAAKLDKPVIFAIGNAPTALIRLYELICDGIYRPAFIIGVPVGFVNVVQSKELILSLENTPYIVARGRKGGSNIAACICNALLFMGDVGKRE